MSNFVLSFILVWFMLVSSSFSNAQNGISDINDYDMVDYELLEKYSNHVLTDQNLIKVVGLAIDHYYKTLPSKDKYKQLVILAENDESYFIRIYTPRKKRVLDSADGQYLINKARLEIDKINIVGLAGNSVNWPSDKDFINVKLIEITRASKY